LVGNIATETVLHALAESGVKTGLDPVFLLPAIKQMQEIRNKYSSVD